MISRLVEPELLDTLPPSDPRAIRSRRDLRLINTFMGNARHLGRAVASLNPPPQTIVELGAGDGTLMLKLARGFTGPVELFLLDMQPVISSETLAKFASIGWTVHIISTRLQDWIKAPEPPHSDLILANLFLHHFSSAELSGLFVAVSQSAKAFVSCDPRRWLPSLWTTRLLWLIGCNNVTRYDAGVSVRAGFREQELSALWPASSGFTLQETPAGFASHLFLAH